MPRSRPLAFTLLAFVSAVAAHAQLALYPALPGNKYQSQKYSVRARPLATDGSPSAAYASSPTFEYLRTYRPVGKSVELDILSDNHWTTLSLGPTPTSALAELEITASSGPITSFELLPQNLATAATLSDGKLTLRLPANTRLTALLNGDRQNPLFLFCDPAETKLPDFTARSTHIVAADSTSLEKPLTLADLPADATTIAFAPGIHYIGTGFRLTDDNGVRLRQNKITHLHLPGGALVIGSIRAPKIDELAVTGRGILAGEEAYPYCETGHYTTDRILNSAITMADYSSTQKKAQLVDGITSILPLKYHIQVGAGAIVRNVKCFSFRQTTDGTGAEDHSLIEDNFYKVNDDVLKLYNDHMIIRRNTVWHQENGAVFQLGWNSESAKNITVTDTILLADDNTRSEKGNSHWGNHSIINWHQAEREPINRHLDHLIDGINQTGMPPIPVWRLLAINMDSSHGPGGKGGILENFRLKNIHLGPEKLPSYIGATNGESSAEVFTENVTLGGKPLAPRLTGKASFN